MSKRLLLWVATAVSFVIVAVIGFTAIHGSRFTIEITSEEAQQRIETALASPSVREKKVQVSSARVTFTDNTIVVDADVAGTVKKRVVRATVHAVGTPAYKNGAFYFHPTSPPVFTNFQVEKAPEKERFFKHTKELLKKKLDAFVVEHGWEEVAETFKAELKEWTLSTVQKGIVAGLEHHPLYTLKNDFKGFAIKSVLEKVEVVGDILRITLSLTQLAYTVFMAVVFLIVAIGCLAFLIMNPEWGVALAFIGSIGD